MLRESFDARKKEVKVPHDALIADAHSFNKDCIIWYEKRLDLEPETDRRYLVYFEGVYMDSTIYIGDKEVGKWANGYTSFYFDITEAACDANVIYVRIV